MFKHKICLKQLQLKKAFSVDYLLSRTKLKVSVILFERLMDNQFSGIEILRKIKGSIDIQIDRKSVYNRSLF